MFSSFVVIFLVFLVFLTTSYTVQIFSKQNNARSEVLVKLHTSDKISRTLVTRGEVSNSTADAMCQPLHFIPHAETRPVTALVSFPGSGNTWLRYLIQQATGVHTGSQFVDDLLASKGFPGEPVFNASVAVVKTHQWGPRIRVKFQKAVLLIRHPKPAIQALFNLYSQGHTGCAPEENYNRLDGKCLNLYQYNNNFSEYAYKEYHYDWDRFFRGNLRTWQLTNLDWIRSFKGPLHIVMYNQLRDNLGSTLRSLVQFLGLPLDEAAIQCTIEHSEGLYHRRSCSDGFDPFTESMKKQIAEVESSVFKELGKYAT